jgi:phospholipid/cholesterol/gamma-HCH transport system ATP-binding protein
MIRFRSVHKSYGGDEVIRGIDFHVSKAETKIILGGSGSGKSTLLRLILGLERPDSGSIFIDNQDISRLSEQRLYAVRDKIGMVFQEGALFDSMTAGENVAFKMRESGNYSEAEIDEIVRKLLGFVGLEHTIDKLPSEVSGGMRRRVAIARALVGNPKIMLYDEATAGLDPITSRVICELMIKLRDLEGVSSIFVTHHLEAAFMLASEYAEANSSGTVKFQREDGNLCLINTRFLVLREGAIVFDGTDEELRHSSDPYIASFIN